MDDDESLRSLVRDLFADQFEVLEAAEGTGALGIVHARHVDVILLDLLMPGLDGLEVLEHLARMKAENRVIVLSGLDYADVAATALQRGAIDYVTKPFDTGGLVSLVNRRVPPPKRTSDSAEILVLVAADLGRRAALGVLLALYFEVRTAAALSDLVRRWPGDEPALLIIDAPSGADAGQPRVHVDNLSPEAPVIVIGDGEVPRGNPRGVVRTASGRPGDWAKLLEDIQAFLPPAPSRRRFAAITPAVSRSIDYVGRAFQEATVEGIAATVHLSASRLSKLFRMQLGMGVKEYVMRTRIEVAKSLLRDTDQKVEIIAKRAGFHDSSHLSRVLRQRGGRSPLFYRR